MRLHVHDLETGTTHTFETTAGQHVLVAELTKTDRDNIGRMVPAATLYCCYDDGIDPRRAAAVMRNLGGEDGGVEP